MVAFLPFLPLFAIRLYIPFIICLRFCVFLFAFFFCLLLSYSFLYHLCFLFYPSDITFSSIYVFKFFWLFPMYLSFVFALTCFSLLSHFLFNVVLLSIHIFFHLNSFCFYLRCEGATTFPFFFYTLRLVFVPFLRSLLFLPIFLCTFSSCFPVCPRLSFASVRLSVCTSVYLSISPSLSVCPSLSLPV